MKQCVWKRHCRATLRMKYPSWKNKTAVSTCHPHRQSTCKNKHNMTLIPSNLCDDFDASKEEPIEWGVDLIENKNKTPQETPPRDRSRGQNNTKCASTTHVFNISETANGDQERQPKLKICSWNVAGLRVAIKKSLLI